MPAIREMALLIPDAAPSLRKSRDEHIFSGLPPIADLRIGARGQSAAFNIEIDFRGLIQAFEAKSRAVRGRISSKCRTATSGFPAACRRALRGKQERS